jgi:hypothetical protein
MLFENGETSLHACMQCLEDIARYIDDFTCGNQSVALDVVEESSAVARTAIDFSAPTQRRVFRLSRTRLSGESASVQVALTIETAKNLVRELISDQGPAAERGGLRDMICARLAPALRVFSHLNVLVPPGRLRTIATPSGMPRACMQIGNGLRVAVDASDQILTVREGEDPKQWDFRGEEDIPQVKLLPFLTYVMGSALIET